MSDFIPPYPLRWPDGLRRSKYPGDATFRTTRAQAIENVEKSIMAFAKDSGIKVGQIQITSNVAGLRGGEPQDRGSAIWFDWDGDMRCIAVDRYLKVEWNLQAIHHVIEADRTKIRHGGLEMVRAAYRGLSLALQAPGAKHWSEVLRIGWLASKDEVTAAYRERARVLAGNDDQTQLQELNVARDAALAAISARKPEWTGTK